MPLNIKNQEAHEYAKILSELTGKSITDVVTQALEEAARREKLKKESSNNRLIDDLDEIALHCAVLPILDHRSADEILGYNDMGVPE